jgi:hypothetical protein
MGRMVRLPLDISSELNNALNKMAILSHASKDEVVKKSLALMEVAMEETRKGNFIAVVNEDRLVLKEITGL